MATGRTSAHDREALKVRRQKIFVGVAGVALLGLVGFQLPGLLSSSSGSGSPAAPPAASAAVPVTPGGPAGSDAPSSPVPRSIAKLASRDLFAPQVAAIAGAASATGAGVILKGPSVRTKDFVAKDVFVPQITPPAASPSTSSAVAPAGASGSAGSAPGTTAGGGYIVVVDSIPGIGNASRMAAARAVVAAKNAGLKDVVANDAVPGESGSSQHFTVYTGPYPTQATAQTELVRALRNGYPHAHAQELPSTSGKGF